MDENYNISTYLTDEKLILLRQKIKDLDYDIAYIKSYVEDLLVN